MTNGWMAVNNELEWIWKETLVAYCEVLTQQLPGDTRENDEELQSQ